MSAREISEALAEVRESLARISTVAALLSGADPKEVDRTAVLRLIEAQAACAARRLEQLEREVSSS